MFSHFYTLFSLADLDYTKTSLVKLLESSLSHEYYMYFINIIKLLLNWKKS